MSLAQARLGTKLLLLSSAGLLSSVLIAAVGYFGLSASQRTEQFLAEDAVPSLTLVAAINDQISNMRDAQLSAALSTTAAEVAEEEKQFTEAVSKIAPLLAAYNKAVDNDEERGLFQRVNALLDDYKASALATVADAKAGDPSRREAMQRQARADSGKAFDTVGDAIDALANFNERAVAHAHEVSASASTSAKGMLLVLTLVVALALAGFAMWITRGLLRQLGGEPGRAVDIANGVAAGDLRQRITLAAGDTESVMAALLKMQSQLAATVLDVRHHAEGVATASAQIAQGNQDLSHRTENQASALQETASSTEALRVTVQRNAGKAVQANQLAQGASTVANEGGAVVEEVVSTMRGIDESSKRIVDIIAVIDGIAFQTNILALNAAVEAARAGEQGRGFAVVASEVRSLAHRSSEAAKEIKSLIATSVQRVEQGTALVDRAGSTIREVVVAIRSVSELVGEISAANAAQSSGLSQVGDAVSQMDRSTQQNAALVEQSAAAAESLRAQADQLVRSVSRFQLGASTLG